MRMLLLLLAACAAPQEEPAGVVLMIGDGMGPPQITLARTVHGPLAMDAFPVTGFALTPSADGVVTDSAAAATALASGVKTNNGVIGMDAAGNPVESILERYRKAGRSVGLVTTTNITHATPACFAAHVSSRAKEKEIGREYLKVKPDVLLGGGFKQFEEATLKEYRDAGYTVARSLDELAGDRWLGVFADWHLPYVIDAVPGRPSLPEMTRRALEKLSADPDGFFLMVEGGRIDHACHVRDAATAVHELVEFDEAVAAARKFAEGRNILIVVTADHCTGGLAITSAFDRGRFDAVRASCESMVMATKENRDALPALLREKTGIDGADLGPVFANLKGNATEYDAQSRLGEIVSPWLGVTFLPADYQDAIKDGTHGHDGSMVPVYAFGPGAERFAGTMDNTDIPKRILGP